MHKLWKILAVMAVTIVALPACSDDDKDGPAKPEVEKPDDPSQEDSNIIFQENFNSKSQFLSNWEVDKDVVTWEATGYPGGGGCVKVSLPDFNCLGIHKKFSGLKVGTLYRARAKVRTEKIVGKNVPDGSSNRGAVIYHNFETSSEQYWNCSHKMYGTTNWTDVYMDFMPNAKGEAKISFCVGFPWGTTQDNWTKGTAWIDDFSVEQVTTEDMTWYESDHVVLAFPPKYVQATDEQMLQWSKDLSLAYNAYKELVGGVPFDGRKIVYVISPGLDNGYWALAGNPILVTSGGADFSNVVGLTTFTNGLSENFGILHEMGHTFNIKNSQWDWNDEMFANLRMAYALDKVNLYVKHNNMMVNGSQNGKYIAQIYRDSYDRGMSGRETFNHDAIMYTILRIKDKYGWDIFPKAFKELNSLSYESTSGLKTSWDKFKFFLKALSNYAKEDVTKTYSDIELSRIEAALK